MTEAEAHALKVQANAATKLAHTALEFVMNLAKRHGLSLDLTGAADAHLNSEVIDKLDSETFAIERDARKVVAAMLKDIAAKQ